MKNHDFLLTRFPPQSRGIGGKILKVGFRYDYTLSRLIPLLSVKPGCTTCHRNLIGDCARGVACEISVAWGHVPVGQPGRCLNKRALEHRRKIKQKRTI